MEIEKRNTYVIHILSQSTRNLNIIVDVMFNYDTP